MSDFFSVVGVPQTFDLDRTELEQAYLERAKHAHPDRFAGAPVGERRAAMERSAAINEAYRTLRNPVLRAEYLVKLGGIDLDSSDPQRGAPHMNQAFLVEMIERREKVAEARTQGAAALDAYRDDIEDEMDEIFDGAVEYLQAGEVQRAAHALVVRRYLQRLLEEIDQAVAV
jgi:molecular chaperone HscB